MKQNIIRAIVVGGLAAYSALAETLPHDAYVWQRSWKEANVAESLVQAKEAQIRMVDVLVAEVSWDRWGVMNPNEPRPEDPYWKIIRVEPDYAALRRTGLPVGLAIRVSDFLPKNYTNVITSKVIPLAQSVIREAQANGITPAEVHLDFDCPESKLDVFRVWLAQVRKAIAPVPLTITTLPCWLNHPASFRQLLQVTDGFVLQVHSLEYPKTADAPFMICDPVAARRAIRSANALGVPFRVALPTYGYTLVFDEAGKLFARGPITWYASSYPRGSSAREVRADETEMAKLVRELTDTPPANCTGIIWYRLPCANDRLNWTWPTLTAVMRGEPPQPQLQIHQQRPSPALVELMMENTGNADDREPRLITVTWTDGKLLAADALNDFVKHTQDKNELILKGMPQLRPGERRMIAWLRFDGQQEVKINAVVK